MLSTCPVCNKRLPTSNLQLHLLRCEQQHAVKPAAPQKTAEPGADSKLRSAKKKKKSASAQAPKSSTEDLDSMLATFCKLDSECSFDRCKKSVRTLGQRCRCCDNVFCLSHHIPEIHGCGLAAKVRARQEAGSAPKRVDLARKANLQRRMDKKLGELSEQRTRKKKEEK